MKSIRMLVILLMAILPLSTVASTLIESKESDGMVTRIYIDGDKARFESPGDQGYAVFDAAKKTMYYVAAPQRLVVDMSPSLQGQGGQTKPSPAMQLKSKGRGPKLLGYATTEYEQIVNGQHCGSLFASTQALKDSGVSNFVKGFSIMMAEMNSMFAGMMEQHMDDCDKAALALNDKILEIGLPLKSFDRHRRQETEVIKLDKKAQLPAGAFAIPGDYKMITPQQFVQEMMQQMPQDMESMMQNIPPEALEQMKQQMMQNMPPEVLEMMKQQMQGQ